jgi:cysteinyl-tRNA synthetase
MLTVDGDKMSKSGGKLHTVREVLARAPMEAVRLFLLKSHYRAELDFTWAGIEEARREIDRYYRALSNVHAKEPAEIPSRVRNAFCDDLNTPAVIVAMRALANDSLAGKPGAASQLRATGALLGILQSDPDEWFRAGADRAEIEAAIAQRLAARSIRDFAWADAIRADLATRGILLEDGPAGTTWRRV